MSYLNRCMEKDKMGRLIKEKLEAYHPEFTEAAWVDFVPHLSRTLWWKTWWGIFSISGILFLGVFLLYPGSTKEIPEIKVQQEGRKEPLKYSTSVGAVKTIPLITKRDEKQPELEKAERSDPGSNKKMIYNVKPFDSTDTPLVVKERKEHQTIKEHEKKETVPSYINRTDLKFKRNISLQANLPFHYSDPGLMRHLFEVDDNTLTNSSTKVTGAGDIYKIKEPLHWDVTVGPVVSWLYPVDGFSTTRLPYSEELFSWRFPGMNIALMLNQKWSVSGGVMGGNTVNYISVGEGYPIENLLHFPDWSEVNYTVDNIRIETMQLLLPFSLRYHQKIMGNFGMNLKVGLLAHRIGDQKFVYNKPIFASSLGISTSLSQDTWQLSYLQGGLGFSYDLSRRFSTYLEGEYWKGIKPIGGEKHQYNLMGVSFGVNYHLFPKE